MNGMKGPQPAVPTSKPYVPPKPEVADMEHFHRLAASGELSDMMLKLGGGKKQ
jgi:hypothetical protein